jgi:ATP-binding cassette subfamily G (WHITE) protein 2 (SNQ2)
VAFNDEKDQHLATLTVKQTLQFAAACRTPRSAQRPSGDAASRKGFAKVFLNVLGTVFGLNHVMDTKVGNDLIRGVSGGEKKRVSISEVLACRALVTMWYVFLPSLGIKAHGLGITRLVVSTPPLPSVMSSRFAL